MSKGLMLGIIMIAITCLAVLAIAGHNRFAGPPLVQVGRNHGLNAGDLFVLATWLVGELCCWRLWVDHKRRAISEGAGVPR